MAQLIPVDPFDLIIFGGGGDLALRKLLPALYHRDADGQLPAESRIIGVGRSDLPRDQYLQQLTDSLQAKGTTLDNSVWARFVQRLSYLALDALDPGTWGELETLLAGHEQKIRAIYLATPPNLYGPVAQGFKARGLMTEHMRIVLEKPVGEDYASARAINDAVGAAFAEHQTFRIDHYLGKETVQNLLALRFGNSLFEPLWRREVVDHIQITVAEELGVGNRVGFYDGIGALRDMLS